MGEMWILPSALEHPIMDVNKTYIRYPIRTACFRVPVSNYKSSYIIDHMEQCHRNVDFSHPCNLEPVNWIPSFCHTYQTHHYYMPFFTKQVRRYIPIGHTWQRNNNNYHTLCSRSPFANSSANFILIEHSATIDHLLLWCHRMNKYACAMHFSCISIHTATLRSHEIDCETGQN